MSKFYTVLVGRIPGVYTDWKACEEQVKNFSNATFKSFKSLQEAQMAFENKSFTTEQKVTYLSDQKPIFPSICTDGACNQKTGDMQFRIMLLPEKTMLFESPLQKGTNNIAEFMAVVTALRICKERNYPYPVYTDSVTAIAWIKNKRVVTTLDLSESNITCQMVKDMISWLQENEDHNPVLKWETKLWGEIPADYNRK